MSGDLAKSGGRWLIQLISQLETIDQLNQPIRFKSNFRCQMSGGTYVFKYLRFSYLKVLFCFKNYCLSFHNESENRYIIYIRENNVFQSIIQVITTDQPIRFKNYIAGGLQVSGFGKLTDQKTQLYEYVFNIATFCIK